MTEENSKETSEISEVDYSSIKQSWKSDDKTSLPSFHWGDVPSDTVYSGSVSWKEVISSSFGEYSLSHPFVFGQQQSRSTHRFSLDVGEEEFLANNGNQPGEVYSSSLNSSYVPFTSSVSIDSACYVGLFISTSSIHSRCSSFRLFSYCT